MAEEAVTAVEAVSEGGVVMEAVAATNATSTAFPWLPSPSTTCLTSRRTFTWSILPSPR